MRRVLSGLVCVLVLLFGSWPRTHAQTLFVSGQNIQPVFEGWQKNPDGTFDFVFGYLNRNYEEEPFVPIGASNSFEPGPVDRGQPTHFYTRRQAFVFSVRVPADWGKKELVWTLNHNGKAATAIASLMPVWEIDEFVWKANRGSGIEGRLSEDNPINKPPTVTLQGPDAVTVTLPQTLTVTVSVSDDGNPGPRKVNSVSGAVGGAVVRSEPPGAPSDSPSRTLQSVTRLDKVSAFQAWETGLSLTFLHYRGPGTVTFDPMVTKVKPVGAALSGRVTATARFSQPGTYVIRAVGDDSNYTAGTNLTVTVKSAEPQRSGR